MPNAHSPGKPTLLTLPLELRLLIYTHLTNPALANRDADYDSRNRLWYLKIHTKILPETKLIYFTLHALSASCFALNAEMRDPIEEVRAILARQKHYLQKCMMLFEFEWMKSSGITWVELERELGIAAGPDFTEGWENLDTETDGGENAELYPPILYELALAKK